MRRLSPSRRQGRRSSSLSPSHAFMTSVIAAFSCRGSGLRPFRPRACLPQLPAIILPLGGLLPALPALHTFTVFHRVPFSFTLPNLPALPALHTFTVFHRVPFSFTL